MQIENDSLTDYEFYSSLNLSDVQPIAPQEEAQVGEEMSPPTVNLLAQEARYVDSMASAQAQAAVIDEQPEKTEQSFWDWMTEKGEKTWTSVKEWFTGKPEEKTEAKAPAVSGNTTLPELDEPIEKQEMAKLRQDLRESFKALEQLEHEEDSPIDVDRAFAHWIRKLAEAEEIKTQDLQDDFKFQKKKHALKQKQYKELCEEYISLEQKRKVGEWLEWGAAIGGTVVGGVLLFAGIATDGQAISEGVMALLQGGVSAVQGTSQVSSATFKYMTQQLKARMIELKEKVRDHDDRLTKVVKDFGESSRRVSKYYQQLSKCKETWRRTVLSLFRR